MIEVNHTTKLNISFLLFFPIQIGSNPHNRMESNELTVGIDKSTKLLMKLIKGRGRVATRTTRRDE